MKQCQACGLVGLDPATYNAFEKGRMKPGLQRALRIEKGTGGAVPVQSWARAA